MLLVAAALIALIILAQATVELVDAGNRADATRSLTPSNEGLWIRAVVSFAVLTLSAAGVASVKLRLKHPRLLLSATLLFSASVSLFAFNAYWWYAAGSYLDRGVGLQFPPSAWRTYPVMGGSLLAAALLGVLIGLLLIRTSAPGPVATSQYRTVPG